MRSRSAVRAPSAARARLELEARELGLPRGSLRGRRLRAEPLEERGGGLHPELEPLDAALQPVARRDRRLATAGGVRELLLGARTIAEQALEPALRASLRERRRVAALLRLRTTRAGLGEIELRDPRAQPGDLAAELLGPLRGRRLERERPQALAHLVLDVAGALDLERDARELQLGAMPPALELPEPRRLLHERPPILRLRREHLLDLALPDDRVHRRAEPDVREDLDEIRTPNSSAVDEVLALCPSHEPPRDRDLREVEIGPRAVLVVEDELDLAVLCGLPVAAACEEHVVGLLGAQLGRRERAGSPDDGVGDVRLAGAVRPDDDGNARLERDLERVGERLEAADAERAQVHRGRILTARPDGPKRLLDAVGHDAERLERLARGFLLRGFLRRALADTELLAGDVRRADELAVVGRALYLDHRVVDVAARAREGLLELRLVVDVARARVLDALRERLDERRLHRLESVFEVDGGDCSLEHCGEDVPAP